MAEKVNRKPLPDEISKEQWFNDCLREYQKYCVELIGARAEATKLEERMFYFLNLMREARESEDGRHTVRFIKDEDGELSFVVERR